jgi:hypothetical protein
MLNIFYDLLTMSEARVWAHQITRTNFMSHHEVLSSYNLSTDDAGVGSSKTTKDSYLDPRRSIFLYLGNKKVSFVVILLFTALLVDMTLSTFSDILNKQYASLWAIVLFIAIIIAIFGVGQYFLLKFLNQLSKQVRSKESYLNKLYRLLTIAQYVIAAILILMIFQIVLSAHYYIVSTIAATALSYALACTTMVLISYRLFSWYGLNKNSTVLFYALASAMVATSTGSHLVTHNLILWEKRPFEVNANIKQDFPQISTRTVGVIAPIFSYAYLLPLLLSFLLMYIGTVLLLHHYTKKVGKIKFWAVICLPLVCFLVGLLPTLLSLPSGSFTFYNKGLIMFRLFSILAGTGGGIFIGVAFLITAKSIDRVHQGIIVQYLAVAGYGIILQTIAIETPMYQAPYPPFEVAASASVGLLVYLYGIGIYLSAVSVSEDVKLRQAIREYVIEESKLLDSIGTAQMGQQIEQTVLKIAIEQEEVLAEQTGVEPSMSEEDVKECLETVLLEVKNMRNRINDKAKQV